MRTIEPRVILFLAVVPLAVIIIVLLILNLGIFDGSSCFPIQSDHLPKEYSNIFRNEAKPKLSIQNSYLTRGRDPISVLTYDKRYSLVLYKVAAISGTTLKDVLAYDSSRWNPNFFTSTNNFTVGPMLLTYSCHAVPTIDVISTSFHGNLIFKSFENDSIVSSIVNMDAFYIACNKPRTFDILFEKSGRFTKSIPMELMIIKSGPGVFFLFAWDNLAQGTVMDNLTPKLLKVE
jgi:hypothetical protein